MEHVALGHPADFEGFRKAARGLLQAGVRPEQASFGTPHDSGALFANAPELRLHNAGEPRDARSRSGSAPPELRAFTVPRAFLALARNVSMHSDPARFALLYRLLWRLREEPRLLALRIDEDVAQARAWEKSVDRDIHKMHAYVRFREVPGVAPAAFIAWFEPTHHIVDEAAPFFVRRYPNSRWTILTPERSALWDLEHLTFAAGARRGDAPVDDATEDLWRRYYSSIFNPARLKVHAMLGHMPKKYWRNLPESAAIPGLVRAAQARTLEMLATPATTPPKHHASAAALALRQKKAARLPAGADAGPAESAPGTAPADALGELAARAAHCRSCALWRHATATVFGDGPADAEVVLVGEQPGDQEDIAGKPFVGPAGQLLDRALRSAGVQRSRLYVTNAVKHFKFEPRGKRRLHKTPSQQEVLACHSWLERELEALRPRLVVALGATAARSLFGRDVPIRRNRGRILDGTAGGIALLVTVHPSYLLRIPEHEREAAFRDFVADLELISTHLASAPARDAGS